MIALMLALAGQLASASTVTVTTESDVETWLSTRTAQGRPVRAEPTTLPATTRDRGLAAPQMSHRESAHAAQPGAKTAAAGSSWFSQYKIEYYKNHHSMPRVNLTPSDPIGGNAMLPFPNGVNSGYAIGFRVPKGDKQYEHAGFWAGSMSPAVASTGNCGFKATIVDENNQKVPGCDVDGNEYISLEWATTTSVPMSCQLSQEKDYKYAVVLVKRPDSGRQDCGFILAHSFLPEPD